MLINSCLGFCCLLFYMTAFLQLGTYKLYILTYPFKICHDFGACVVSFVRGFYSTEEWLLCFVNVIDFEMAAWKIDRVFSWFPRIVWFDSLKIKAKYIKRWRCTSYQDFFMNKQLKCYRVNFIWQWGGLGRKVGWGCDRGCIVKW